MNNAIEQQLRLMEQRAERKADWGSDGYETLNELGDEVIVGEFECERLLDDLKVLRRLIDEAVK